MKRVLFFTLCIIICMYAASIEDGINWLKNKQNPDGTWGNPDKLGFLETVEVLNTFIALSETTGVEKALFYLENQFPENTDFMSRKLSLFVRTNRDFYFLLQQLLKRKNDDGGFGFSENYKSSIWETMLTIEALKHAGLDINEILPSLSFILINQNADGGFGFSLGDSSHTLSTAYCTYILSDFRTVGNVNPAINRSVAWLIQVQNPDSGFGDEGSTIYETAITWLAMRSVDAEAEVRQMAFQYIASRQDANGSWNNSIYNTALALRAIQEGTRPNFYINSDLMFFDPVQPNKGDTIQITAQIVNNGDSEAPSAIVTFRHGATIIDEASTSVIAPQDTGEVQILWNTENAGGLQTVTVEVDAEDIIKELNEDDNIASKQIFIQDTLPPETLDVWVSNPYFSPNGDGIKDYTRLYFTASEDVTVDINVLDQDLNVIKTIVSNTFYEPGRHSVIWDGTNDVGNLVTDDDYLFEVQLVDIGNNVEIRNAFVCVDINKTTVFASLDPYKLKTEQVFDENLQWEFGPNYYYPTTDQMFLSVYDFDSMGYYLLVTNAQRDIFDTLCFNPDGCKALVLSPNQKVYYMKSSQVYCFDLSANTENLVISDTCIHFELSPDGGKIAYIKQIDWGNYDLYYANANGTNKMLVDTNFQYDEWSSFPSCAWSPDGQYFLYHRLTEEWEPMLVRSSRNGSNTSVIFQDTLDPWRNYYFEQSLTGGKIALFNESQDEEKPAQVWLINSDGSDLELLIESPATGQPYKPVIIGNLLWNPDETEILVAWMLVPFEGGGTFDLWTDVVNITTKEIIQVLPFTPEYEYHNDKPGIHYVENGERLVFWYDDYVWTCDRYGQDIDSIIDVSEIQYYGSGPTMFTDGYCAMMPNLFYYTYSQNNLKAKISSLGRLAQTPDMLTVFGTVCDRNFEKYVVEYGYGTQPGEFFSVYEGTSCIYDTILANWVPPQSGTFTIRLTGLDHAGNTKSDTRFVNWQWETVITDLRAIPDFISPDGDSINDFTTISYYLVHPEPLSFQIRKKNTLYRTFFENHEQPGAYTFTWDGTDTYGALVDDGTYTLKIFGMMVPIVVDSAQPMAEVETYAKFKNNKPYLGINALAWDGNFSRFTLDHALEDTLDFSRLLYGYAPVYILTLEDSIVPDTLLFLNLRNCVGNNFVRLTAEDRAGHVNSVQCSLYIDSLVIHCDSGTVYPGALTTVYLEPMVAMARLEDISEVTFYFSPDSQIWPYKEVGKGTPIYGEDYLYLCDTVCVLDDPFPLGQQHGWLKCIVSYQSGKQYTAVAIVPIKTPPGGGTEYLRFVRPCYGPLNLMDTCRVSGIVDVEANFFIVPPGFNAQPEEHPECLDNVAYSYTSKGQIQWHNIGIPAHTYPFAVQWYTMPLSNGFYYLRALGTDTLGVIWIDTIQVYVDNSTPIVNFITPDNTTHFIEDDATIIVEAFPHPIAAQYGATIDYVIIQFITETDTIELKTDWVPPYSTILNTTLYADSTYILRALAFDTFGNMGKRTRGIKIDNTPPEVLITQPANGDSFYQPDTIDIYGKVYDRFIDYFIIEYRDTTGGPWSYIAMDTINIDGLIKHWNVRALPSGCYNLKLAAYDGIGHTNDTIINITVVNSPAPDVALFYPHSNSLIGDTCSIIGKVMDDDLQYWTLSYGQGSSPSQWFTLDSATYTYEGTFLVWDTGPLDDTIYTIKLYAIDEIGRDNVALCTVTVDNTPPIAVIDDPVHLEYIGVPFAVIGTAMDQNFDQYTLSIGEGLEPIYWSTFKISNSQVNTDTLGVINPLPGMGWWTIKLLAEDKVGHVTEDLTSVVVDTLPPAPPTGLALQDSFQQVILTWDNNTEPDLDGYNAYRNHARLNSPDTLIPSPFYLDSIFVDGEYTYYVTAVDWFNLESDPSESISIYVDVTGPVVVIHEPYDNQWVHGVVEIVGTVTDDNFQSYTVEVGQGSEPEEWIFVAQSYTPVVYDKLASWNTDTLDSVWTIKVRAKDTYNNQDSAMIVVRIDNMTPIPPQGLIATTAYDTVQLEWMPNPEPDIEGYRLYRNGVLVNTDWLIADILYSETRPDGEYNYYVTALDSARNESSPSDTVQVEIDIQAPHAVIIKPEQGDRFDGDVDIRAEVEDNDVRDITFEFKFETGIWETIGIDSTVPYTIIWNTDTLDAGKYYLKAIARDNNNNVDPLPDSIYVFLVDDLDPPLPPQGLITYLANDTTSLYWQPNTEPDLAGYNIYEHLHGQVNLLNSGLITDTNFVYATPYNQWYYFSVTAVDTALNESEHSSIVGVDCEDPFVLILSPEYDERVKGMVPIVGTAHDDNLNHYIISYGVDWSPAEWETLYVDSQNVYNDTLTLWYTGNLPDSIYTIKLEATDEFNNYSYITVSVYVDHTPPVPPQNLAATLNPDSSIQLQWDHNTEPDLAGYNAYYSVISGTGYVRLNTEIIYGPPYDTQLPGGITYYFVATALDLVDNESGYSNEDSITPPVEDIDLAITEQDIIVYPPSPVDGDTALIVANVHNLGTHEAVNVECDFYIKFEGSYDYLGMVTIPEIPANSSAPASVSWQTSGYAGTDTVCVFVDPNDRIIETDEENNDAFKEVIVRPSDIVFSIALDDTIYEPHTDIECQFRVINLSPEVINFLSRFSILDSLGDTLNGKYDIESFIYIDDTIPQGGIPFGNFSWDTTLFYKGTKSITHEPQTGEYEYGFQDAQEYLSIQTDQAIIHYVYLDEENIPSEIMLEFEDDQGSKEHRAYWGANLINRGTNNTASRRYLGELPQPGNWVQLVVPAETVGLADTEIKGISYVLYNGKANWDQLDLGLRSFEFSLNQGDSLTEKLYWNTKNTAGGIYEFLASLFFNSQTMYEKQAFRIIAVPGIVVDVYTDKIQYTSYEHVTITSVIANQSSNYTYHDITENIILIDSLGTLFYDTTRTIDVLLPQTHIQTEFYWNTGITPPGVYRVFDYVTKDNDTLAIDSALFHITPSGGSEIRLTGMVRAEPKIIPYPDSFIVHYQVTNIGNIDLDSLPIRTQILDGETFDTLITYIDTLSLLVNETKSDTFPQSSTNFTLKPYALTLDALVEDTILNIAVGGFYVIDVNPPVIVSISPTGVIGGTITIQAQISDDLSGVDSAFYKIAGDYEPLTRISGDSLLGVYTTQFNTLTLADGDYYLTVKARDYYNNEAIDSVVLTVDNTPPEISISGVSDSVYYNIDVTPVITIIEPHLDSTTILLNGEPFESGTIVTDDGEYTLYVYALDLAGNDADTSIFFIIDKTAPGIAISGVADSTWYNHTVTPFITFTDPHLDSTSILLNGEPFESGEPVEPEGEYTLYAWAQDKATNTSDTSIYFVIDKTPPDPPVMVSPPESTTVPISPITIEGLSEPYSFVNLNIEGTLYDTIANNLSQFTLENVSLASGWNLLKFTARDKAGNVSDTAYYHLNLGIGIELEASIYIPQKFGRILVYAGDEDNEELLRSLLDSLEVFYTLVVDDGDFADEFHTGKYNLYLVAGEKCKLHPHLQDEIIEIVNAGDGLVVTTRGVQHMHRFEEVFDVKFKGHIPANKITSVIFFDSPISQPDTLSISAKVVKFEVHNSTLAAEFNTGNPAAVTNEYGDGRAVFFGFDATDIEPRFKEYLINAITYATPDTTGIYPGATIPVEIYIKNLTPLSLRAPAPAPSVNKHTGKQSPSTPVIARDEVPWQSSSQRSAIRLNIIEALPENFIIIAALDSGEISGPTITWNFAIEQDSTRYLRSVIQLPNQEFTDTISAEISYLSEGNYIPYDTLYLEISTVTRIKKSGVEPSGSSDFRINLPQYLRKSVSSTINVLLDEIIRSSETCFAELGVHYLGNASSELKNLRNHGSEISVIEESVIQTLKEAKNLLTIDRQEAIDQLISVAKLLSSVPEFTNLRKKIDFVIKLLYNNQEK